MPLNRRDFLKFSTAGATLSLAGCTPRVTAPPASHILSPVRALVVVVGAGFGGATCAKYLRQWGPNLDVTLIEARRDFVSCPLSNWVLGGLRRMSDITKSYDSLPRHGIKMVHDTVIAIDTETRSVTTQGGARFSYDRLVLSPGIEILEDSVKGYREAEAAGKVVHAWKAGPQTALLRKQLEAMPDGGTFVISVPLAPFRCPPAPYERASLVAHYFQQAKPRSKIILLDGNPDIASKKALFQNAWQARYPGMIDYRPNNAPFAVDGIKMIVSSDFEDIKGDVLNVVPKQRAGAVCGLAGARNDSSRAWCRVNLATFESTTVPQVHILGDSVLSNLPKSGHTANSQAKIAAAAIIELLSGRRPDSAPVVANTCYSATSGNTAGYVANVFRLEGAKGYVVQHDGGSTEQGDTRNFEFAQAWAENIWADVLG